MRRARILGVARKYRPSTPQHASARPCEFRPRTGSTGHGRADTGTGRAGVIPLKGLFPKPHRHRPRDRRLRLVMRFRRRKIALRQRPCPLHPRKARYRTQAAAVATLSVLQHPGSMARRRGTPPRREYRCPACSWWHLTSREQWKE